MEDNRSWYWFEVIIDGNAANVEHWFTSMDNTLDIARSLIHKVRRFNKAARVRVKIVEDNAELELVAICDSNNY